MLLLLGLSALGLLLVAALSLLPALGIQRDLTRARASLESGRNAFLAGRPPRAQRQFDAAASAFIQARASVNTPFLNLASALPILGRTPDSIEAMAAAGANVAGAAGQLTGEISRLPGGLGGLAPADGAISLLALVRLEPVLRDVTGMINEAVGFLNATNPTWLLPPVARAREQFEAPLNELARRCGRPRPSPCTCPTSWGRTECAATSSPPRTRRSCGGRAASSAPIRS